MKRKIFKFFGKFLNLFLVLELLLLMGTIGVVVASYFVHGIDVVGFIYLILGELIVPIEYLFNGGAGGFNTSTLKIVAICVSAVFLIFIILTIKQISKIGKKNKSNSFVKTLLLSFVLCAYAVFNLVILILQYKPILRYFKRNINGFAKIVLDYTTNDFVLIKGISLLSVIAFFAFVIFILNFICKEKIRQKRIAGGGLTFYSSRYLKIENSQNNNENSEVKEIKDLSIKPVKQKKKKQSEDLISKIMQLNKLKDEGKIGEVEYTKLRQRLIRRYKG